MNGYFLPMDDVLSVPSLLVGFSLLLLFLVLCVCVCVCVCVCAPTHLAI